MKTNSKDWRYTVMPAVFTWLKESQSGALEIDFDATQKYANDILSVKGKGGTKMGGLVGSGTLGENTYLSDEQRLSLLKALSSVAKQHNVPLISGAAAETKEQLAKIVTELATVGVDTVMVMPPKTTYTPSDEEMYAYYALSAKAAKEVGITIMPYNNPDAAGYHALSTDLLTKLAALPEVTALKISTIDVSVIETMMLMNKDLKVLAGVDTVTVHAGLAGACGGITGVGCIFPKASVTMQEHVNKGEWAEANKISQAMNSISYLDAQPLLLEYLKLAFGIHHNDVTGGLRTLGEKLTQQQIDDVQTRYIKAKERLEILGLID
ncbi:MAG TPA: dihydrodipicolinate synthase family protein [Pseudoalteromonas sp.]|uniref:Dihydrodipicolinate synthase n=1 Tax=marine sediment metagenome TaxID=412755 RepID=A0A0F9TUT8_9ZZZZ|nr:dihydrodipicolinate synthase family protein [Pseudoalteromonas sp.]HDY93041.1 dihydrodipicolinate synthase family protein [Pseudoalteromonas sp.]HDZ32460.1 dihydrodipicolinate synthase family protein [Pseudoalteromonas sp.]